MLEQKTTTSGAPMGTRRPVGRPRGKPSVETVDAILDAAERVFGHVGFAGGTLQEIAKLSGITKPTVIYYFGSKEKLYQAVLDRLHTGLNKWGDSIVWETSPTPQSLDSALRGFVNYVADNPHIARIAVASGGAAERYSETMITNFLQPVQQRAAQWLEKGIEVKLYKPAPTQHLFHMFFAMTTNYFADLQLTTDSLGYDAGTDEAIANFTESIRQIVFRALGTEPPELKAA